MQSGRWARVLLPWRPNGSTGWVAVAGHRLVTTTWSVDIDLSRRRLALQHGRTTVARFVAGIGASDSPTPTGRFFVTDLVVTGDPGGPFGWFAFGLSGHQPNLPSGWQGGDQLAIHGTNEPWTIGEAASAGCIHLSAGALGVLRAHLRLGSPVRIHP
jgi:lipoprotein-anchoring transpeptidase ErfK/SrfK